MKSTEKNQKAIRLYRSGITIQEIANLCDVAVITLSKFFRKCFEDGTLKPRRIDFALKPRVPNGKGKKYIKKGRKKRITDEILEQMAIDYYVNNFTLDKMKAKYNMHPEQLQRMRLKYSTIYGRRRRIKNGI